MSFGAIPGWINPTPYTSTSNWRSIRRSAHHGAGTTDGQPDAGNRLAGSLNNLLADLAGLRRQEDALAVSEEAVTIRRDAMWPDDNRHELERSLRVAAWVEDGEDLSDAKLILYTPGELFPPAGLGRAGWRAVVLQPATDDRHCLDDFRRLVSAPFSM